MIYVVVVVVIGMVVVVAGSVYCDAGVAGYVCVCVDVYGGGVADGGVDDDAG